MMIVELQNLSSPLGRYACMMLIREFEEKIAELFSMGLIGGTAHLCIGQEACAVGAVSALAEGDCVVSSHRGHGHFLAKGVKPYELMSELLGKRTGVCLGRGGSQHLCKKELHFFGTNGITAGGIPIATGIALASKIKKTGEVTLCFFGDGATNQGTFHESLNMASIWHLPVVYICENNLYAMSTHVSNSMRVKNIAERAKAYGIPGISTDGMDVEILREVVSQAVEQARNGEGPSLIECSCYRFCGHSKSDRLVYRTREEEQRWANRDPLKLAERKLTESGHAPSLLEDVRTLVRRTIKEAYEKASDSPEPSRDDTIASPYKIES